MFKNWLSALEGAAVSRTFMRQGVRSLHRAKWEAGARMLPVSSLRALSLEVTNHCNLACVMCANRWMKRPRGFLSQEVFELVLDQVADGSLETVSMFAVGEPLLHRDLPGLCTRIRAKTSRVVLSTNVVALGGDRNLAEDLMGSGIGHVHVSADGYDADSYEKIRHGARFEDLLNNLRILKEARDRQNPAIEIELQYCLAGPHDLSQIARVLSVYGPLVDRVEFKPLNNQAHEDICYSPREKVFGVSCYLAGPYPCRALWSSCTILWDGQVSACCRDHDGALVVGNIHDQSLNSIWRSAAYRALRRDHLRRRFPQRCQDCSTLLADETATLALNSRIQELLCPP